jgi:hypothetical protein
MRLGRRNKNIYGLGVGISVVFEILGHFLVKGGRHHHVVEWLTLCYIMHDTIRCYLTQETNIYGLGVRISMVFEIFGHFLFKVVGPPCTIMTYIPLDATWHNKQEYIWFRSGDLNSFWKIWALPVSRGTGPLCMVMTYIQSNATWHKKQYIYGLSVESQWFFR